MSVLVCLHLCTSTYICTVYICLAYICRRYSTLLSILRHQPAPSAPLPPMDVFEKSPFISLLTLSDTFPLSLGGVPPLQQSTLFWDNQRGVNSIHHPRHHSQLGISAFCQTPPTMNESRWNSLVDKIKEHHGRNYSLNRLAASKY